MLRYCYHQVAIFTLTSVLVIYVIVLDRTMEACWIQVRVSQASRWIHWDTVACLVNRGTMREIRDSGLNNVAFQWSQNVKHKKYEVQNLVKTENLQDSLKILHRALKTFLNMFTWADVMCINPGFYWCEKQLGLYWLDLALFHSFCGLKQS